jgi:hypothetical protein
VDVAVDEWSDLMTFPCVDEEHFEVTDDGDLTPQWYMQWRHVATTSANGIQKTYNISGGDQSEDLVNFQVDWTNDTPIDVHAYVLLTRGGAIMTNNVRNVVYLETYYGQASGASPSDPTASTLFGRFGGGADLGTVTGPNRTIFTNHQLRQGERTLLVGSTDVLEPGESIKLRVRLRWAAHFWETLPIATGATEAELSISTGASRLDVFAYPAL